MDQIFLPTLHSFENNNIFTGSFGLLRFKLTPKVGDALIAAEIWHGLFCYEKSEIEETQDFPMTEAGREALLAWLTERI